MHRNIKINKHVRSCEFKKQEHPNTSYKIIVNHMECCEIMKHILRNDVTSDEIQRTVKTHIIINHMNSREILRNHETPRVKNHMKSLDIMWNLMKS